ncbi:MAG: hypothetical protein FJ225_07390 [Lentisphaerae bacterium]|nr:hypothetical protein [Lentisphaerota bacterium]
MKQERRLPAEALAKAGKHARTKHRRWAFFSVLHLLRSCLMFHVCILRSLSYPSQIYIGFSAVDMPARLRRHNEGSTPATSRYRPWQIARHCTFPDKQKAMEFEACLKSGSGRAFLHKRLIP